MAAVDKLPEHLKGSTNIDLIEAVKDDTQAALFTYGMACCCTCGISLCLRKRLGLQNNDNPIMFEVWLFCFKQVAVEFNGGWVVRAKHLL